MEHVNNTDTEKVEVTILFFAKCRELVEKSSAQVSLARRISGSELVEDILILFPWIHSTSPMDSSPVLPVIANMGDDIIVITSDVLQVEKVMTHVRSPSAGAISLFVGTTRDNFEGQTVVRLEYEAYVPMARSELRKICKQARERWNLVKIAIFHRTGIVPIGEASVIIAVSSAHRKDSLNAVEYCIDTLKATVPIWKKEVYEQGEPTWKENKECHWKASSTDV